MTRADEFHAHFHALRGKESAYQIAAIEAFYSTVHLYGWTLEEIVYCYPKCATLRIRRRGGERGEEVLTLGYDSERNAFSLGELVSDACVAEILGTPVAYVQGLLDGILQGVKTLRQATDERDRLRKCSEKSKLSRQRLLRSRKRLLGKTERIKSSEVFQSLLSQNLAQARAEWEEERARLQGEIERLRYQLEVGEQTRAAQQPPLAIAVVPKLLPVPVYPTMVGIYFLCRDGEVLYVGQSVDIIARASTHAKNGKVFDSIYCLPCPNDSLDSLEREWIDRLIPELNNDPSTRGRRRQQTGATGRAIERCPSGAERITC